MFKTNLNNTKTVITNIEAASAILLSSLTFLLPLLYIESLRDPSSLPRYTLYGILSGIILSLVLIKNLAEHKSVYFLNRLFLTVLAFLVWAWLSLSWSIDPKNSLLELIQLSGCIIIGFSVSQITNIRILTLIIICSVIGASIASAIGIAQYFNFNPLNYRQFSVPASTFTNTNIATTYLDLVTPVAFSLIFIANKKSNKILAVISSILCLSFLLISHSRGSWLGLVFILSGLLLLTYKNTNFKTTFVPLVKQHKTHFLVSILIPFLLFSIPPEVLRNAISGKNAPTQAYKTSSLHFDNSMNIRLDAYINSISMLQDQPVTGTGIGGFKTGFRENMFRVVPFTQATEDRIYARLHNDVLQSFIELGFIGGILFISIYIILLRTCWIIIKNTKDPHLLFIVSGIFLAIIANGIHAFVDFPFHKPSSALQFWIWAGIISAIAIKTLSVKNIYLHKFTLLFFIVLGLLFSIYNFNYYKNYITASAFRLTAENSINIGNCNSARNSVDKMMDSFDADFRHQSLYIAVYSHCDIDNSEKLSAMNKVLDYDSSNTRARLTRAMLYLDKRELKLAWVDFDYLTVVLPHRPAAYLGLGNIAVLSKNYRIARKYYEKAKSLDPGNQQAEYMLNQFNEKGI